MTRILGISGSLRRLSFNTGLLRAAAELAPDGVSIDVMTLEGVPLYDADVEAEQGPPSSVVALKDAIAGCDGLLLATPEYNNGIPGVFKNAIDWASRPAGDIPRVFGGRPVALVSASPGGFGAILSQTAWLPVLRALNMRPWFGSALAVSRAGALYSADGVLKDEPTRRRLADFVAGFAGFVGK